jgi:glucose-6-phosphate 1-epimerase
LPEPAAIRGGVPVCWPWFAKQGQASSSVQHGPVRNLSWQISSIQSSSDDCVSLSLEPVSLSPSQWVAAGVPTGLQVRLCITLGQSLRQTLHTHNRSNAAFELTQALHSYYAVSHAQRVKIDGLQGLSYTDRLQNSAKDLQREPFALEQACDRTYEHSVPPVAPFSRRYTLSDPAWQRRIVIDVEGSRSVVVWNPGCETARQMSDVPDANWSDFICIEAVNAGPDVIHLQPGEDHALTQHLHGVSTR